MCGSNALNAYGRGGSVNGIAWLGRTVSELLATAYRGTGNSPATVAPPADYRGQQRQRNHDQDDPLYVVADARNIPAQEISGHEHAPNPASGAENAEGEEPAIRHDRCSGRDWCEC